MRPQLVVPDSGVLNKALEANRARLKKGAIYKNAATVCVIPTRGAIPAKVVQAWFGLMSPMNHPFIRLFLIGMEVGQAYTQAVEFVTSHPDLKTWPYLLTLEEDNIPPPDGLLKLIEAIDGGVDGTPYDAVGGLYWTKGEGGQPMIYGDPAVMPRNFQPQVPKLETVQPCNGLGMGFTLFRTKMLLDPKLPRPLFETRQAWNPSVGTAMFTQDLWFFNNAAGLGYKFACDTRVRVGHYDVGTDITW